MEKLPNLGELPPMTLWDWIRIIFFTLFIIAGFLGLAYQIILGR